MSAPISIRGERIGELAAAPAEDHEFTEGDQVVLQAVADRVSLAIENARLFHETQMTLTETWEVSQNRSTLVVSIRVETSKLPKPLVVRRIYRSSGSF